MPSEKGPCRLAPVALVILLLAGIPGEARSGVVLNNLDQSNDGFTQGEIVGGAIVLGDTSIRLASVVFPQIQGSFVPGETFAVAARNGDGTVGATLFGDFTVTYDAASGNATAAANTPFTLQANTGYWLLLGGGGSLVGWDYTVSSSYVAAFGITLPGSMVAYFAGGGDEGYFSLADGPQLLEVNGVAVPEPSTVALAALAGGIGVLAHLRRRSRA